jgi:hypothetical protein
MILLIITMYVIICLSSFDELNRRCVYLLIRNFRPYFNFDKTSSPGFELLALLPDFLMIPFGERFYIEKMADGGLYGVYLYEYFPALAKNMNDKLYWNNTFTKHQIAHPALIAIKQKGIVTNKAPIDHNQYYITKPICGARGYKITKMKGSKLIHVLANPHMNNILAQEYLYDCNAGKARHYRLVTLYNGQKFILWRMEARNVIKVASNAGDVKLCANFICTDLNAIQQEAMNQMAEQLQKLHKEEYSKVVSIGWDLMINCEEDNIKVYCLEGNICASIWFGRSHVSDEVIIAYKEIVHKFLKDNKY